MDEINDNSNHASNNDHKIPEERLQETSHSVTINGKKISYTAHAGTMLIKKEEDEKAPKATAEVFYVSYYGRSKSSDRPVPTSLMEDLGHISLVTFRSLWSKKLFRKR